MSLVTGEEAFEFLELPTATFETDEGDLTVAEDVEVDESGSEDKTWVWVDPILENNLLIITANRRVKKSDGI